MVSNCNFLLPLGRAILLLGLVMKLTVEGSSYDNPNTSDPHYTITQNVSLDPHEGDPMPISPIVCCSTTTMVGNGDFLVSAMMIHGGDINHHPLASQFLGATENEEEEDDESEDEDNDDDDGHSSMLSNSSLRRSFVANHRLAYVGDAASSSPSESDFMQRSKAAAFIGRSRICSASDSPLF
jgi:hypothetical protein